MSAQPPPSPKTNTINITACDNEIIIVAYQNIPGSCISYELCRVYSGYWNEVNVSLTLAEGAYTNSLVLNGLGGPLNKTATITIPKGPYSLLLMGINWGGGQEYKISVNGDDNGIFPRQDNGIAGLAYHSTPLPITV